MAINISMNRSTDTGEIVIYQPDDITELEVRISNETIWLTQSQIAQLFGVGQPAISKHLRNIFSSGELEQDSVYSILEYTASDGKSYKTGFYNLDAILSVGYRVNSKNATIFRQWANTILREHLIKGYTFNSRLLQFKSDIEKHFEIQAQTLAEHDQRLKDHDKKFEFFIRTSLPPIEGIFFDGQIFDAYVFISNLIKSAKRSLILIDNYIDESVLVLLLKRAEDVKAEICTGHISPNLRLDIEKFNSQYAPITISQAPNIHDRFLIVDDDVYHIGASLKDLGKKLFAFSKMNIDPKILKLYVEGEP